MTRTEQDVEEIPASPVEEGHRGSRRSRSAAPEAAGPGTGARRRPSLPLVPVLAVLLAALIAAGVWLALPWFRGETDSPVRTDTYVEVLQAARSGVVDLTSFDAVTIDDDIEQVRRVATGDLRDESLAQLQDRRQQLVDAQAVVQTEVVGAGVVAADEDSGTVLLVIQSTQQSTESPQAQVLRYRIQVELVREDGRWVLSGITGR